MATSHTTTLSHSNRLHSESHQQRVVDVVGVGERIRVYCVYESTSSLPPDAHSKNVAFPLLQFHRRSAAIAATFKRGSDADCDLFRRVGIQNSGFRIGFLKIIFLSNFFQKNFFQIYRVRLLLLFTE